VVHSLVHIISGPPFAESSVTFASETAMDIIVRNNRIVCKRKIEELLQFCQGNPLTGALCGYIFESYAIELLEKGGECKCRQLVHGNKKRKPDETTLTSGSNCGSSFVESHTGITSRIHALSNLPNVFSLDDCVTDSRDSESKDGPIGRSRDGMTHIAVLNWIMSF